MLNIRTTKKYNQDLRRCAKRGYNIRLMADIVNILRIPALLPQQNRDHKLSGNFSGYRECHVESDWILVYRYVDGSLELSRTGTHSDIFNR